MIQFLNEHQVLVFGLVKVLLMLGFFVNMAPLLVFAERRQSALIQDRVGPNRAVVTVPGMILKGALATPALILAVVILAVCFVLFPSKDGDGAGRGFWLSELATFLLWTHAMILAGYTRITKEVRNPLESVFLRMEDPRWIFYTGLILHAVLAIAYAGLSGQNAVAVAAAFATGGPAYAAVVLFVIAAYLGYAIPNGKVEIRAAGLFHSLSAAIAAAFKEDFIPANADKLLHALGPLVALFPALVTYAVVPFGDTICFESTPEGLTDFGKLVTQATREPCANGVHLQIVDMNVGILYMFAIAGTGIVGAAIAGWSSDNKWSLLGGLRAASQMVSYEVAMGLSIVGAFMIYGTPRLDEMVRWQEANSWGIFVQPLAFVMFFAATIAEQKRVPFDAPEGESEIVAGYFVEYSSFKWLMFYTGEYIEMVTASALLVTIFLGGWTLPFLHRDGITMTLGQNVIWQVPMSHLTITILQVLTFFTKVIVLSFGQIFIRWTVPRFRYDQIMSFGWKMLLPASIANLVVTGLAMLILDSAGAFVQSSLRVLAEASNYAVLAFIAWVVFLFARLLLSPIDRGRFTGSTSAVRTALRGGVKEEPMQA